MGADKAAFIREVVSSRTHRPDGTVETTRAEAVWTLAHRGYSGGGRLDVWAFPTKAAALRAGAELAMECGLDEDAQRGPFSKAGSTKRCWSATSRPARTTTCSGCNPRSFRISNVAVQPGPEDPPTGCGGAPLPPGIP